MINKSVMKCCICNNDNIGEFITINDKKYHLCCIEQLKKQKEDVVEYINHKFNVGLNYSEWSEGYNECVNRHKHVLLRMLGEIDE